MAIARTPRFQSLGTLAGNVVGTARVSGSSFSGGGGGAASIASVFGRGTSMVVDRAGAANANAFLLQLNQRPLQVEVYNLRSTRTKGFEPFCRSRSYCTSAVTAAVAAAATATATATYPVTSSWTTSSTQRKKNKKNSLAFSFISHPLNKPCHHHCTHQHPAHTRQFSSSTTTPSKMSSSSIQITKHTSSDLLELLANRRSHYKLDSSSPISDSQITEILQKVILTVPSAFNTQSTRFILTLGDSHHKVWDTTTRILRAHMGEERWSTAPTGNKLAGFRAAHGTVLCYDDTRDVSKMKENFPAYKDKFDAWADHSQGMHQIAVWTAFSAEGLGCNLQHYNPIIDADLAKEFDVPEGWELKAQLVFGGVADGKRPDEKEKKSVDELLKTFS